MLVSVCSVSEFLLFSCRFRFGVSDMVLCMLWVCNWLLCSIVVLLVLL